ncbi:hypothetical protein BD414DRAFT_184764 [Trametes punicea]|nr:hypothetical protein BD414DRAFT_184764 [Trametes punicea]
MPHLARGHIIHAGILACYAEEHDGLTAIFCIRSDTQVKLALSPHHSRITGLSIFSWTMCWSHPVVALMQEKLLNLTALRLLRRPSIGQPEAPAIWCLVDLSNICVLQTASTDLPPKNIARNLKHLELCSRPYRAGLFASALNHCSSLVSLKLMHAVPEEWRDSPIPAGGQGPSAVVSLPGLRTISICDVSVAIQGVLCRVSLPQVVKVQLYITDPYTHDQPVLEQILSTATILRSQTVPSIARLYVGNTRPKGRVQLLGYTAEGQERLVVSRWGDFEPALAQLIRPFAHSAVTALAINLPHLPPKLDRTPWEQDDSFMPPVRLQRLELLEGMSLKTKQRFVRWFLRSCGREGRPLAEDRTLCWSFNVERGRDRHSHGSLLGLETVLAEFSEQRLGRLELYGTPFTGQIFTNVARVPTHPGRCADVAERHMARLKEQVAHVVIL